MRKYKMQLKSLVDGAIIASSGGKAYITAAGGTAKATLYDSAGAALANPITLTRGALEFYTADSVAGIDLYCQTPTGHFVVRKGIKPSGDASLLYNNATLDTTFVIPFNIADTTATTETSTGFTVPSGGAVQPNPAVDVVTVDATEDIDVGTLSSDTGDADGYIDSVLLTTAGYIKATLLASADTMGALLSVLDSANAGDDAPEQDTTMSGKTITYTLSAGTDTAAGFIVLKMALRPSVAL